MARNIVLGSGFGAFEYPAAAALTLFVTFIDLGGLGGARVAAVVPAVAVIPVAVEVTGLLLIAGLVSVALDAGREAGARGRQNSLPRNRYTSSSLNCMRVLLVVPEGLDADEIF